MAMLSAFINYNLPATKVTGLLSWLHRLHRIFSLGFFYFLELLLFLNALNKFLLDSI
jgi:hypothetical protein